jgi:hypothetical protein
MGFGAHGQPTGALRLAEPLLPHPEPSVRRPLRDAQAETRGTAMSLGENARPFGRTPRTDRDGRRTSLKRLRPRVTNVARRAYSSTIGVPHLQEVRGATGPPTRLS